MSASVNVEELLTTKEAARILGLKPNTLEVQRSFGKGPPYVRLGERGAPIRYSGAALLEWMVGNTSAGVSPEDAPRGNERSSVAKLALSVDEAASATGLCRAVVFRAIHEGKLQARKLGARTLILQSDLQRFLEQLPVREVAE